MKKFITAISLLLIIYSTSTVAQSCLPEGITFTTQEQIDNFQTDNPGCTEIEGTVTINGNDITNLNGLNVLTSIGRDLEIVNTNSLKNLSGLEKLNFIGNNFTIGDYPAGINDSLINLDSLYSLDHITGFLQIEGNPLLKSIEGLSNLTYIGRDLLIYINHALLDLTGLNNIKSVGGGYVGLHIINNDALISLNGLNNLEIIHGQLYISENSSLINFSGLNNLTSIENHFNVFYNSSLINFTGLENLTEVSRNASSGCPGSMSIIHNDNLRDFTGLSYLDSVFGDLEIYGNDKLKNLEGLSGLKYIQGKQISDDYSIVYYGLDISENKVLESLSGLDSLKYLAYRLQIYKNDVLSNIDGIRNVSPDSILRVDITHNPLLASCDVKSICEYLANSSEGFIWYNAPGCNSQQEVIEACASSINEISALYGIKTQPNPFSTSTTLSYELKQPQKVSLSIYNHLGQIVYQIQENQPQGKQQLVWNAEVYPDGIYYYKLQVGEKVANGKMVKVR